MKSKTADCALDPTDQSPHLHHKMGSDDKNSTKVREAKLAIALRANLRRRKVPGQAPAASMASGRVVEPTDSKAR